jgi:hypothetical protein
MMFAVHYDDFKRRIKAKNKVEITLLSTCQMGTPEFEVWSAKFCADDNTDIHMLVEDDKKTYSFFNIAAVKAQVIADEH